MKQRGLLGIEELERDDIELILDTAFHMKEVGRREVKKVPTLRGRTIINLFFEPSTRTRTSFEIAGKRLSADVVNFSPSASSLTKKESILDTAKTLDAMDPDAVALLLGGEALAAAVAAARAQHVDLVAAPDQHPRQVVEVAARGRDVRGVVLVEQEESHGRRRLFHAISRNGPCQLRRGGPAHARRPAEAVPRAGARPGGGGGLA